MENHSSSITSVVVEVVTVRFEFTASVFELYERAKISFHLYKERAVGGQTLGTNRVRQSPPQCFQLLHLPFFQV